MDDVLVPLAGLALRLFVVTVGPFLVAYAVASIIVTGADLAGLIWTPAREERRHRDEPIGEVSHAAHVIRRADLADAIAGALEAPTPAPFGALSRRIAAAHGGNRP